MSMDPVYRYMMPYPYQTDHHVDFRPNYYPRSEAAPPHMYMTPTRPPVNCEHWPWGSNYGYAYPPVACHGCCNHSQMPNHYSWRPPYSHVPPSYAPVGYPTLPSEYMPPYYRMEHPQFAYVNMPRDHHCCGCPNHLFSQKEQKNVKIEEEEPERGSKKDGPIAPFKFKNSPYPLMWLPIDNGSNNEHQKYLKDGSGDVKLHNNPKTDEKHPGTGFGWYPFESIKSGSPGEKEENKMSGHESDAGKGRFPFPMFWMPYMSKEQEKKEPNERNGTNSNPFEPIKSGSPGEKEENRISNHESDDGNGRLPFSMFWMPKEQEKEEPNERSVANSNPSLEPAKKSGEQTSGHADPTVKDIPVKEVKSREASVTSQSKEVMSDSSHRDGISADEKLAKDNPKKGHSSSPKTSKLPPVCLRVDPLPRRKNTNGKSRSPSPPGDKRKADHPSDGVRNVISSTNHEKNPGQATNKKGKGTTKAIKVVDGSACLEEHSGNQIEVQHNKDKVSTECTKSGEAVRPGDTFSAGGKKGEISSDKEVLAHEVKEPSRPKMSEEQATVIIQSAYRGFVIRRWEPVKKLKQIARVREKMAEVSALIQAMESSSDVQGNDKQRTIIAETIMSLLLELDTIQGLHASIREVRKSVVRELVALQEKLDAVIIDKAKALEGQQAAICDENSSKETVEVSSQGNNEAQPGLAERCPMTQLDGKTSEASEISEELVEEPEVILRNKTAKTESCITGDSKPAEEPIFVEQEQDSQPLVFGEDTKCFLQQSGSSDGVIDSMANADEPQHESTELPNEVSDDNYKHLEEEQVSRTKECSVATEDQVLGQDTKCSLQQNSSSDGMTESVADGEEAQRELTEQPKEVFDSQCASAIEHNEANQQDGLLIEENMSESNQDVQLGEVINLHVMETNPGNECTVEDKKLADEFGTTKQAQDATENDNGEPGKCFAQSPMTDSTSLYESPQAYDKTEHLATESSNGEEAGNIWQKASPIIEKEEDMLPEKELNATQKASTESPDADTTTTIVGEEVNSGDDIVVSDQYSGEHQPLPVKNEANFDNEVENTPEIISVAPEAERDEKLIEENERLRDMVEKLVKSSQDQLRVISGLSGRVKDLERNLSKKRKVKVKPRRGKRSGSLEEWTDGVAV